jgi:hypothetical protein
MELNKTREEGTKTRKGKGIKLKTKAEGKEIKVCITSKTVSCGKLFQLNICEVSDTIWEFNDSK